MTRSERDHLRSEARRLLVEASIAAGGDLDVPRSGIVKALLRQGAGRTFAYDLVAEVVDAGEVEAELLRRGFLRHSAERPKGNGAAPALPEHPQAASLHFSVAVIGQTLQLLDQAGELMGEAIDHADTEGGDILLRAMRAAEAVEALLRGSMPGAVLGEG